MATKNIGFQSFYQSQLTSSITNTDLTIPLDTLPTPSEGYLVIESTVSAKREIIYYTSKTATAVVVPSGAGNGRGFDGTTAVSHTQGATVIMAPIGAMFGNQAIKDMLGITADPTGSWNLLDGGTPTVSSVTANGNRSYTINFASDYSTTLSPGMRLKTTRTVAAPTQCTSLNGTSQYYSKTSPAGMAQTDDITVMAWVKLSSYQTGAIVSKRTAGTNGWDFLMLSDGTFRIHGVLDASNYKLYRTFQSIPLNKWVHIAATMDMSGNVATLYMDGISLPYITGHVGTANSLTNATTLNIGSDYSSQSFPGKIAQVGIFSAVLSQATIRSYYSQGLTGSESNLISAYSFNNSINDLNTTNANNLTAQGSAVATNADSPFGCQADGTISSTLDYSIITKIATTAVTVQVPEGCTIPTTGGVAGVSYATVKVPYGFPAQREKWVIESCIQFSNSTSAPTPGTWYPNTNYALSVPIGEWMFGATPTFEMTVSSGTANLSGKARIQTTGASEVRYTQQRAQIGTVGVGNYFNITMSTRVALSLAAATSYCVAMSADGGSGTIAWYLAAEGRLFVDNAYL